MNKEKTKRYGHGRWPRGQLYAIVAKYREQDRDEAWVATKLGLRRGMVRTIWEYLEWQEEAELLVAAEAAGGDPLDDLDPAA